MSDNQAKSTKYIIPVALIVLSLITSVLLSQLFQQGGSDSTSQTAQQTDSSTASGSTGGADDNSVSSEESAPVSEPGKEVASESEAPANQQPQEAPAVKEAEAAQETQGQQADEPVISDLAVLVPSNNALCDGQAPWREGELSVADATGAPGCYGLRFELSTQATVLLLKLTEDTDPRSLLAEGCRPFGFNSAQIESGQVQRLPRGVDSQPGVFQVGSKPSETRFVLVAAAQPQEQMTTLAGGVANLCGQGATLNSAQVQEQLDALAQLEGVFVEEVQAKL